MSQAVLATHGPNAGHGEFQVLFGVDFHVDAGEVVALIGANGAGKSTLMRSLMGVLPVAAGMVRFDGANVGGSAAHRMVKRGLAMVPERRRLFTGMTVGENLLVAAEHARALGVEQPRRAWTLPRLHELFPILKTKCNTPVESLSGGQQQMVSIGRALMSQPRVLLCDELPLGLAPLIIKGIYAALPSITAEGPAQLIYAFEAVIIGGMGSIWGAFLGAMVLGVSQAIGFRLDAGLCTLAWRRVFPAVLALRPQGQMSRKV